MSKINKVQKTAVIIDIIVRVIGPLYVFINPVWGAVISLILDCLDFQPLVMALKIRKSYYDLLDKFLDFYWYVLILIYVMAYTNNNWLLLTVVASLLLRLVGVISLVFSRNDRNLVWFPNIVEPLFWVWIALPYVFDKLNLLVPVLLVIILVKVEHEKLLHIRQFSPINYLREKLC